MKETPKETPKETLLVRLKPHDPRRGHVLRRYTYLGIKFQAERGWYRVEKEVAAYLRAVRQVATDEHAPRAFDVCTEEEAKAIDAKEKTERERRRSAVDALPVTTARTGAAGARDEASDEPGDDDDGASGRSGRRARRK